MGMDGLSIANTGIVKESTSAELANKTEQAVRSDALNDSQQVQNLGVNQRVRRKNDEDENSDKKQQNPEQEEFQDGLVENKLEEALDEDEDLDVEDIENPNKDFYVKLNSKDDIIELYDSSTNRLIETISGSELSELVKKLNMASGIFINKKV